LRVFAVHGSPRGMHILLPLLACVVFAGAAACSSSSTPEASPPVEASLTARACARLSGCWALTQFDGIHGVAACASAVGSSGPYTGAARPIAECLLSAASCDDALDCLAHDPTRETCASLDERCEGTVLEGCFAGVPVARDCAAEGLVCRDDRCVVEEPCSAATCDGDVLRLCVVGGERQVEFVCEPSLCRVSAETGAATCAASSERCEPGSSHCEGDVAVACVDGFVRRTVCQPGACRETDGAFCTGATCEPSCEDTSIRVCDDGGFPHKIDCTQWGFSTCTNDSLGVRCSSGTG
jgi:hypothetical protein